MASSPAPQMVITSESIKSILTHKALIDHLRISIPSNAATALATPLRQSHTVSSSPSSSLLIMPSWSRSPSLPYIGVKLVTHFPANSSLGLPGVQATYNLFSSLTGHPLASIDGTALTLYRTASVSGLASTLLARPDSRVLAIIGAGSLAPHLVRAHLAAIPALQRVLIWNRTSQKASDLAQQLQMSFGDGNVHFESRDCLEEVVAAGDVVSCATNSEVALVQGRWLKCGAHLDLVGSFKPEMKECDDEAIKVGRVFVDNEAALVEAGELVGAFERGVIEKNDVCGTLVEVLKGEVVGRRDSEEITVFKSVGSALVDILAAQLVYENSIQKNK